MCLAAVAIAQSARFPWILASNRDEFHARATLPLAWWPAENDASQILGGRDLGAGGTWLAVRADGRLALVTNVREPGRFDPATPSRGELVVQGLQAGPADTDWLQNVSTTPRNGFNLMLADLRTGDAAWATNRPAQQRHLSAGIYGLSNASLDTPWPKVGRLKRVLEALAAQGDSGNAGNPGSSAEGVALQAFAALADRTCAADGLLPHTGIEIERERQLSPSFIHIPATAQAGAYGTRCSTVVVVEDMAEERRVHVFERRFDATGHCEGQTFQQFSLASAAREPRQPAQPHRTP